MLGKDIQAVISILFSFYEGSYENEKKRYRVGFFWSVAMRDKENTMC